MKIIWVLARWSAYLAILCSPILIYCIFGGKNSVSKVEKEAYTRKYQEKNDENIGGRSEDPSIPGDIQENRAFTEAEALQNNIDDEDVDGFLMVLHLLLSIEEFQKYLVDSPECDNEVVAFCKECASSNSNLLNIYTKRESLRSVVRKMNLDMSETYLIGPFLENLLGILKDEIGIFRPFKMDKYTNDGVSANGMNSGSIKKTEGYNILSIYRFDFYIDSLAEILRTQYNISSIPVPMFYIPSWVDRRITETRVLYSSGDYILVDFYALGRISLEIFLRKFIWLRLSPVESYHSYKLEAFISIDPASYGLFNIDSAGEGGEIFRGREILNNTDIYSFYNLSPTISIYKRQ